MVNDNDLKAYANKLRPLIRPCIRIEADPNSNFPYENSNLLSHFKGRPYFDEDEEWPHCEGCGSPLEFIIQIGASKPDKVPLPKHADLLQFYICPHCRPTKDEDDGWLVKFYDAVDVQDFIEIEPPYDYHGEDYCHIKFHRSISLPDWEGIHARSPELSKEAVLLYPDAPWKIYQKAVDLLEVPHVPGSYLYAYPQWIQSEESPDYQGHPMDLLLQIDSEDDANINWVDMGMVYLFYHKGTFIFRMQYY